MTTSFYGTRAWQLQRLKFNSLARMNPIRAGVGPDYGPVGRPWRRKRIDRRHRRPTDRCARGPSLSLSRARARATPSLAIFGRPAFLLAGFYASNKDNKKRSRRRGETDRAGRGASELPPALAGGGVLRARMCLNGDARWLCCSFKAILVPLWWGPEDDRRLPLCLCVEKHIRPD
jgi:hypothetical protein